MYGAEGRNIMPKCYSAARDFLPFLLLHVNSTRNSCPCFAKGVGQEYYKRRRGGIQGKTREKNKREEKEGNGGREREKLRE